MKWSYTKNGINMIMCYFLFYEEKKTYAVAGLKKKKNKIKCV